MHLWGSCFQHCFLLQFCHQIISLKDGFKAILCAPPICVADWLLIIAAQGDKQLPRFLCLKDTSALD